jgi:hypothetical protein
VRLADICRSEDAYLFLPIEHLGPGGPDASLAGFLTGDCDWSSARVDLLRAGFATYWERGQALVAATGAWPSPRVRNVGIAGGARAVRPYAQVLGTSTWTLYECDLDPDSSHAELVAYLLALGDWMAMTGEVTQAGVRSAMWWAATDEPARAAFCAAAARSARPDAASLRAVASALPWIEALRHRQMRPPPAGAPCREIPGTGLLVPQAIEAEPQKLVDVFRSNALAAVETYRSSWKRSTAAEIEALSRWLTTESPLVVITDETGRPLWDPDVAAVTDRLERALADADGIAVTSIAADLRVIDGHSRRLLATLRRPDALALPDHELAETGYAYMFPRRHVVAYNLREPGMERLTGPPLPFERTMLGARTLHEWAHLADESGWVAASIDETELARRREALAEDLARAVHRAAFRMRNLAQEDLDRLCVGRPPGEALAGLLLERLPDYRANLVARAFMTEQERAVYARHNIRTLRHDYAPTALWRMLVRYLYEYQYVLPALGLITLDDPYAYFAASTGFEAGFVDRGVVDRPAFFTLAERVADVCGAYRVDTAEIRLPDFI